MNGTRIREMKARMIARQFCWLEEVNSRVNGCRAGGKKGRNMTVSVRADSKSRQMDYPG